MPALLALLAACAASPAMRATEDHFRDELFAAPAEPIEADDLFALSAGMREYLQTTIAGQVRAKGAHRGLFDALYSEGQLKLDYDASITRNAAQAFEARAGNCLSLVIMTAAFAKALGVEIRYQSVIATESWARNGDLYVGSGHVNLVLGRPFIDPRTREERSWRIDFRPPAEIRASRTRIITEATIVAMYLNNRANEALLEGKVHDAYWWAREAISYNESFLSAYNTLGVVYIRSGELVDAERAFRHVLEREPLNVSALANLAQALRRMERVDEASAVQHKLRGIEGYPPFHFFDLGVAAMQREDFRSARDHFTREIERDAYHHEFHFWLAMVNERLGNLRQRDRHLRLAIDYSPTPSYREFYLESLRRGSLRDLAESSKDLDGIVSAIGSRTFPRLADDSR